MKTNVPATTAWKWFIISYALLALGLLAYTYHNKSLVGPDEVGGFGATTHREAVFGSKRFVLDALAPDSPLRQYGAKPGDMLEFDIFFESFGTLQAGETVGVTLFAGDAPHHIMLGTVPVTRPMSDGYAIVNLVFCLSNCLLGLVIGLKRADNVPLRALSFYLVSAMFNGLRAVALPGTSLILAQYAWHLTIWPIWASLAIFAVTFLADDASAQRKAMARRIVPFLVIVAFVILFYGWIASHYLAHERILTTSLANLFSLLTLFALWDAWRHGSRDDKQRHLWLLVLFGARAVVGLPSFFTYEMTQDFKLISFWLHRGGSLMVCAGLAYAILRHRVLNFSFAINRALVYTIISTMLLMVFSVTEWAVDKLLHFQGREKNAIVDAIVALCIILCFHRIQHGVRHQVDQTFFHHWYEAAKRFQRFLDRAEHISDSTALQTKFMHAVDEFATSQCSIYLAQANQTYRLQHASMSKAPPTIDGNNDALVDLRHDHRTVDLSIHKHALPGALAIPMMVRGNVHGLLLLDHKADGQIYRPDEVALLETATHQLGLHLEGLRVEELERTALALEQKAASFEREANTLRLVLGSNSAQAAAS